ncbi:MAG: hypothetical protein AMXMBFR84_51340 [Candidatus Hydrogenedentota bacterium]
MEKEKQRPEKKFRVGAIAASVWKRVNSTSDGRSFEAYQVSLDRTWLDKDGQYRSSNTYGMNDIPKAVLAMELAYEYIATKSSDGDGKEQD